jgi:dihydroorotase
MESAMKQGILPGTISSDVHQFNVAGPVFDLVTTLSKFLHLGMSLEQVIERATVNPAKTFRFPHNPGTLRVGAEADVAVLQMAEGDFELQESYVSPTEPPEIRIAHRKLVPVATVKAGKLYGSASIPVVRL